MEIFLKELSSKETDLLRELKTLIDAARSKVATTVNSALVMLYWDIGNRIRRGILQEKRADYGKDVVKTLSTQLTPIYGRGFAWRNLFHMMKFSEIFDDREILHSLSTKLSWTHFRELIQIKDDLEREFYTETCRLER